MSNRLANENSPYLLQHADNPVDWYPWGKEALKKAEEEDKPIFLSIGYAACHWCHVMEHESFEDPTTAAFMNEHFVNIKVDREERPDLDNIYMNAVVALTGQGGWPMSVFLTPDGKPFYGGTYFPPVRRYNMPSFQEVLETIARLWREDRERLTKSGEELATHLRSASNVGGSAQPLQKKSLEDAAYNLAQSYDWKNGGWGKAPKFPQPMIIDFLLGLAQRGDRLALQMSEHALSAMAAGGMYDVVGGGFARYSVDDQWLVPHFEKMLYDNAQLARVYLHAFLITKEEEFRQVCTETLDFIIREMMASSKDDEGPIGGMFSSLDADSEGEEGKFYVWTLQEIRDAVTSELGAELFIAAFSVTQFGNFEGKNVLQRKEGNESLAKRFDIPLERVQGEISKAKQQLLAAREQRVRPGTDDKVLVSWNALGVIAFAEAARYLDRKDYLEIARQTADFLLTELHQNDRLLRSWRKGKAQHNAYLEDYAGLIWALLDLYQSDPDPWWFNSAVQLADEMVANYRDPEGGFYDTREDQEDLITRPKDVQDNAVPSGNSLAAVALLQLSALTGEGKWWDIAEEMLGTLQSAAVRYPTAFGQWLMALDFAIGPIQEIAVLGDTGNQATQALMDVIWSQYRVHSVVAVSDFPPKSNAPALLKDRTLVDGKPTAYVCEKMVCKQPVTTPQELEAQLAS